MPPEVIITGMGTAITAMATFIAWQFKRSLDDKDKQIAQYAQHVERLISVNEKHGEITKESLRIGQEARVALDRIEGQLRLTGGRRSADK